MHNFEFRAITGLLLAVLIGTMGAIPALAGPNGTTSGETAANAIAPAGGTLPLNPGEMSVRFTPSAGGDTRYADTSTNIVSTVDTGFDMSKIDSPVNVPDTISAGDSIVYEFPVTNLGNNAQAVPFNFNQIRASGGTTASFAWELFAESGGSATQFDTGSETRISDTTPSIQLAENEKDTLYAVITARPQANNGDTLENRLFATDNAPIAGDGSNVDTFAGDQWEDSGVISDTDDRDTQFVFFQTNVAGPVIEIAKEIASDSSSGSYRPGDTVGYLITVENTGSDTADNVEVVDAMPDSTTYVAGSAVIDSGTADTAKFTGDGIGYSTSLSGGSFSASEPADPERINWAIDAIGPSDQSNSVATVRFQITID